MTEQPPTPVEVSPEQQAALDALDAKLGPLMEQVADLDTSIPLAVYAPASVAAQKAARDELVREGIALLDEWFGVTR
jgi:hypothetical protein